MGLHDRLNKEVAPALVGLGVVAEDSERSM